ncbi:hypothetical protein [Parahaliea aestuarii]|uniref:Peptidase M50 domain-containing protein n=1 Tax=Parahaliea aestuarii TaxID=1852021 RepID=A0A5C8ZNP9_9GAMM|nr:hypothetical protein [Parahaliea aestuarii]TXS89384.1 hypothetical protein FVW59_17870 [Parahaliea aestuarii]
MSNEDSAAGPTGKLRTQALVHLSAFLASAGVFISLDNWALATGAGVPTLLAILAGLLAGFFMSHIFHEWGHFFGARLAGAATTIKAQPAPLFFDFDYAGSTARQTLALSAGGPLGNVLVIVLTLYSLPVVSPGRAALLAGMVGSLVFVLFLELPVTRRIRSGEAPIDAMMGHFGQGKPLFRRCTRLGVAAGAATFLTLLVL